MQQEENDKPKRNFRELFRDGVAGIKHKIEAAAEAAKSAFDAVANYRVENYEVSLPIDFDADTVWATYEQMATLFGTQSPAIVKHVANIYNDAELVREGTTSKMEVVRQEGDRQVRRSLEHFNLDVILAVGYRVNSKKATEFRKWATTVLKGYIEDGYALNGKRLNNDPAALLKLAQEVRAIRVSEKNLYQQVRETFKQCSIDYDPDANEARTFFSTSQDMFHYATSGMTAKEIILARADAKKPQMGLLGLGNKQPTAHDVTVAKNYCSKDELRLMELIGEAWLTYAEGMAVRKKQVSMARLLQKLEELIELNEYPVFPGYPKSLPSRDDVNKFAKSQLAAYKIGGSLPPPPV